MAWRRLMDWKHALIGAASSAVGAILLVFGSRPGIAKADAEPPILPFSDPGSWSTRAVAAICAVVVIAVVLGVYFIRRARAKRRASGPGAGR
jgi:hypothetical protein